MICSHMYGFVLGFVLGKFEDPLRSLVKLQFVLLQAFDLEERLGKRPREERGGLGGRSPPPTRAAESMPKVSPKAQKIFPKS